MERFLFCWSTTGNGQIGLRLSAEVQVCCLLEGQAPGSNINSNWFPWKNFGPHVMGKREQARGRESNLSTPVWWTSIDWMTRALPTSVGHP